VCRFRCLQPTMPSVLAYWDLRGLAQPVRLLLNYVGEEFEDKKYECGEAPEYSRECWMKEKHTFGLAFPNLPFYIDGDIKITQSNAILRYIGRKYNLCGKSDQEKVMVDMMLDTAMDFRNGLVRLVYNPNFKTIKTAYLKELPAKLAAFDKFVKDKKFFAGDEITVVDFHMYELLDQHRLMEPGCLKDCTNLSAFMDRFEALSEIKKYMESDRFMKWPLNNKMAQFGQAEPKPKE